MKIAFFEMLGVFGGKYNEGKEVITKTFTNHEVSYFSEKLSEETALLSKDVDVVSVFNGSLVNRKVIDLLPNLKFINTSTTGFEHIDLGYCKEKGITVSNIPAYASVPVAEFTFALLLNLSRKVSKANSQLRQDDDFVITNLKGFDLSGKTLGVVGTGKIGRNVIKIAKGFDMKVIACNNVIDKAFEAEMKFTYKTFDEVVAESDIITLHVPYTKENDHLINKDVISKMKRGVYLINTARGGLIDTEALIWGLREGVIAGAGLDVLEGERELKEEVKILSSPEAHTLKDYKTLLEDHMLIDMPNVVVTPHIAFYSAEAETEIIRITIENLKGFLDAAPINLVK